MESLCQVKIHHLKFKARCLIVLLGLMLAGLVLGVSTVKAAEISGKVTTKEFPDGAAGVSVTLYKMNSYTGSGDATDRDGNYHIYSVSPGNYELHYDLMGYRPEVRDVIVAEDSVITVNVNLKIEIISRKVVKIATASVSRHEVTIKNSPIRTEVVVPEEVQDKIAFSTSVDDAMRYSGGVVVNTSRNIYESENIRLRGLDSRYLLFLGDQMPVLGYQPEGVGIWTIPLVGIKQLEIVKGDYSALYGFGNAGLINTIIRTPFSDSLAFFGLVRSDLENNRYAGLYAGKKLGYFGLSGVLSGDSFEDDDGSSAKRYVVRPRIDYQPGGKIKSFAAGAFVNSQKGDSNIFKRNNVSVGFESPFSRDYSISVKSQFAGQTAAYAPDFEAEKAERDLGYLSAQVTRGSHATTTVFGLDGYRENWRMLNTDSDIKTEMNWLSLFLQNEWTINDRWIMLYDGRISNTDVSSSGPYKHYAASDSVQKSESDYAIVSQNHVLSFLWKPEYFISYRFTGSYASVPLASHYLSEVNDNVVVYVPSRELKPERNWNVNLDMRMIKRIGNYWWTGSASLFMMNLQNHIDIYPAGDESFQTAYALANASYVISGAELFFRLDLGDDAAILLGYTLLLPDSKYDESPGTLLPLPHSQGNFEIDWEIESTGFRVEVESKVVGGQETPNNPYRNSSPPYTIWGLTVEYTAGPVKVFGGAENLTEFVQKDAGPLWGPREGRQIYLGLKSMF